MIDQMTTHNALSRAFAVVGCAVWLGLATAAAQSVTSGELSTASKTEKDVDIEADSMQVLEDEQQAVFTGNVDATRGTVRLNSDKLVVHYKEKPRDDGTKKTEVTHLDANGNVVIVTRNQRITGQWAKMNVTANELTVGGNVVVVQGKTIVKGKKLFVDLDTNKSEMTGGRVKGSFVPGE